ncbi:MAG TPA: MAPEG family protein [Burkholderiales bacterium]|nr:MAPEG family protein [Burkholderiales bacterium]
MRRSVGWELSYPTVDNMLGAPSIFFPVLILALWTIGVLVLVGYTRIRAAVQGAVKVSDFRFGESSAVPERVRLINRNYMNLLEVPVLYYVVCVVTYVVGAVTSTIVFLAWLYVALRIAHSCVHLTYNNVLHRLYVFVASNIVLLVLWIAVALHLASMR